MQKLEVLILNALSTRKRLLATTVFCGAMLPALAAMPAMAQDTAAQEPVAVEEIVVTGSRIARPDLVSSSPVATVGDKELKQSGVVNTENLLNTLPQAVPGITSTVNNGGSVPTFTTTSGSATVTVNLTAHGVAANDKVVFDVATAGNGVVISGTYTVVSVTSAAPLSAAQGGTGQSTSIFSTAALPPVVTTASKPVVRTVITFTL